MAYGYKKEVRINLTPNLMTLGIASLFFCEDYFIGSPAIVRMDCISSDSTGRLAQSHPRQIR